MAATPPKPPVNLMSAQSQTNNSNSSSGGGGDGKSDSKTNVRANGPAAVLNQNKAYNYNTTSSGGENNHNNNNHNNNNNIHNNYNNGASDNTSSAAGNDSVGPPTTTTTTAIPAVAKACNCSNISIKHLFLEMKQEFPTIPDHIVTQCVHENCHQRENCLALLRKELALNPTPLQTYPAKVIQRQQHLQQQQQQLQQQQQKQQRQQQLKPPLKPLRPQRAAPVVPAAKTATATTTETLPATSVNCDNSEVNAFTADSDKVGAVSAVGGQSNNLPPTCASALASATACASAFACGRPLPKDVRRLSNIGNGNGDINDDDDDAAVVAAVVGPPYSQDKSAAVQADVTSVMPSVSVPTVAAAARTATHSPTSQVVVVSAAEREHFKHDVVDDSAISGTTTLPPQIPRARPTTLNLLPHPQPRQQLPQADQPQLPPRNDQRLQQQNEQQDAHFDQQQQKQLFKIQLQQNIQQRQQQQQQQQQPSTLPRLRKAPLPPIAPKPASVPYHPQHQLQHSNSAHSQPSNSCSTESCLTSPISSAESEISSMNVSLSSPTTGNNNNNNTTAIVASFGHTSSPLKSPIRHRAVINVQPEPPYTRDFLVSPTTNTNAGMVVKTSNSIMSGSAGGVGSPIISGGHIGNGQKSYTSVNLTLRQPAANSVGSPTTPPSTIDISAGPGRGLGGGTGAGNGGGGVGSGGLTYSSRSYDARLGYQKNFHITVTDEGGVFSASRIRPRSFVCTGEHETNDGPGPAGHNYSSGGSGGIGGHDYDGGSGGGGGHSAGGRNTSLRSASSMDNVLQPHHHPHTRRQGNVVISSPTTPTSAEICPANDALTETLQRQKDRRDKLATALRDNQKRLQNLEQEINVLIEPIPFGQAALLDDEIQRLRNDCNSMLNERECARQSGGTDANYPNANPSICGQQSPAFPTRHRPPRPPQPRLNLQQQQQQQQHSLYLQQQQTPHLDFIQHHSNMTSAGFSVAPTPATPYTPPPPPAHASAAYQRGPNTAGTPPSVATGEQPPPTYQQYCEQYHLQHQQTAAAAASYQQQQQQLLLQQQQQQQLLFQQQQQQLLLQQQQQQQPRYGDEYSNAPFANGRANYRTAGSDAGITNHHTDELLIDDDDDEGGGIGGAGDNDDDDEEVDAQLPWSCELCTFLNHPQLNICETCDNVRILRGTIRIIPTGAVGGAASVTANSNNNSMAGNSQINNAASASPNNGAGNLPAQQRPKQPQFALHT